MEQNEKNQDLIDLSNQYANKVENMQLDEALIQLNNDESSTWLQGYQLGFQTAIEHLKQNNN